MAIPVITGKKSETEIFAGAVDTYAIEAMMQDKKALQAGTSHFLGQNFAKAFDVTYQTKDGDIDYVWATSWGVSTRLIGALVMAHSDDKGLVIPPRLAPTEVVIVPIFKNKNKNEVLKYAEKLYCLLKEENKVYLDTDDQTSPGWKFSEWEMIGVPIRVEAGPRDMEAESVVLVRRDTGEKIVVKIDELVEKVKTLLIEIQESIFKKAYDFRKKNTFTVSDYNDFKNIYKGEGGFVEALWCGSSECEAKIKADTKATIRILSSDQEETLSGTCIVCNKKPEYKAVFARAY